MAVPPQPTLSASQLDALAKLGEECTARPRPCTEWLGGAVARHEDGFLLTGEAAVGKGSMAVQLVHEHLSAQPAEVR